MAAPIINSISFDKTAYVPGDTITATVNFTPGSSGQTQSLTGMATDTSTGLTGALTVLFTVAATDATTMTATDSGNRVWTLRSQTAGQAVLTAVA